MSSRDANDSFNHNVSTNQSTLAKNSISKDGQLSQALKSGHLPSIFDTYLKMNPMKP